MHMSIEKLFDPTFAQQYLTQYIPKEKQKNISFDDLTITPIKRTIRAHFYHIVLRFDSVSFHEKPIFLSAHSHEDRSKALEALAFISTHNVPDASLVLPEPLFFEPALKAFAYRGLDGKSFYEYLTQPAYPLEPFLEKAAQWIAFLHTIPTKNAHNFNPENSRIETTVPGPAHYLPKIKKLFPKEFPVFKETLDTLIAFEKANIAQIDTLSVIHGDFHPENIIIAPDEQDISVIDFTDICLADWARDIGSFIQQIGFMGQGHRSKEHVAHIQTYFVDAYTSLRNIRIDTDTQKRINAYHAWAALRSSIYFFSKKDAEPQAGKQVLNEAQTLVHSL